MTWKLRLGLPILIMALMAATAPWWVPFLGSSLVCDSGIEPCDVILIDNQDPNYLLFEKAEELRKNVGAKCVLILLQASGHDPEKPGLVPVGIAEVMIRVARLESAVLLPIQQSEPITLNVARQVAEYLRKTHTKKVLIVAPGFRSRRTQLTFQKALGEVGIDVRCFPVWGTKSPENWTATWHGIQSVLLQHVKLAYYRLLVF